MFCRIFEIQKYFAWVTPELSANFRYLAEMNLFELKLKIEEFSKTTALLKFHNIFNFLTLTDLFVYDLPGKSNRFVLIYYLRSFLFNSQIAIKLYCPELAAVPSSTKAYASSDWLEREAWDMFGITFSGHPNLRRILTDYNFSGHPLRKDFPMSGFKEIYHDDTQKRIVYVKVELSQEYRNFQLHTVWEGSSFFSSSAESGSAK